MINAKRLDPAYVTETFSYVGDMGLPLHPDTFKEVLGKTDSLDGSVLAEIWRAMDRGEQSTRGAGRYDLMLEFIANKEFTNCYPGSLAMSRRIL